MRKKVTGKMAIVLLIVGLLFTPVGVFARGKTDASAVNITFWTALTTTADKEIHSTLIKKFEAENPGITVTAEYVSHKDWFTRLMTSVTSGDTPDIVLCDQSEVSWMYYQDMLEPMNSVLKKIDPTGTDFVSGKASIASCQTPDGQVWGIPFSTNINAIWYRKDILAKAGIDPASIKTWDDLYNASEKTKGNGLTAVGMALAREAAYQQLLIWTNANGGNFFDEKTGAYLLDIPGERKKVAEALEYLKKLNNNGMFPSGISNWMWVDYRTAMANGELVFTSSWAGDIGVTADINPPMLDNLGVIVHPSGPSAGMYPPYHDAGLWAWSVPKNKNQAKAEVAVKWVEFFFRPENVALACSARPVYNLPLQRSVLRSDEFYKDPVTAKFKPQINYLFENALPTARRVGFEAGPSIVAGQIQSQLFLSDAVQNYLFNGWTLERTMTFIDTSLKGVMKEFNYPLEGPFVKK
ncbi:hypothetical protein AGMMS50293_00350 [Spirochaetia bacterium]|nr:hypothetical protein AGMMS50293_00350 [Spirochaetia bacterium]